MALTSEVHRAQLDGALARISSIQSSERNINTHNFLLENGLAAGAAAVLKQKLPKKATSHLALVTPMGGDRALG